ncbi:hypothetical protein [Amycolatopsis sp. FDAARGOS 1241]|uniref:hypothetical protein n=1 Tax=Amycolatopsis sp. FDAARGOS 1241 TaxID=2778070 RepID=UPI0019520872|nr:hypothetical protein [Amycolatopsis sp. FDAARGOS 1241]QRP50216.1 hypothetical protein I6J71_22485 [Amycolatopsis sp. FDAARGOS 1241]
MSTRALHRPAVAALLVATAFLLTSCAAGADPATGTPPDAGFWLGLWHGLICPITFLVSLFDDHVGIYEVHNNGHLYDFGFVLGVIVVAGVLRGRTSSQRRRSPKNG